MNILKLLYSHLTIVSIMVKRTEALGKIRDSEFGDCRNQLRCETSYQVILSNYVYGVHRVRYATRDSSRLRHESYRTGSF